MRAVPYAVVITLAVSAQGGLSSQAGPRAGRPAAARTMRVDYYHTGNDKEERFSIDRILL